MAEPKTKVLSVRFTAEEQALLDVGRAGSDLSLAAYVRTTVLTQAARDLKANAER